MPHFVDWWATFMNAFLCETMKLNEGVTQCIWLIFILFLEWRTDNANLIVFLILKHPRYHFQSTLPYLRFYGFSWFVFYKSDKVFFWAYPKLHNYVIHVLYLQINWFHKAVDNINMINGNLQLPFPFDRQLINFCTSENTCSSQKEDTSNRSAH